MARSDPHKRQRTLPWAGAIAFSPHPQPAQASALSQPLLGSQDDSATRERKLTGHSRLSLCPTWVLERGFLHKIAQYSNKSSPGLAWLSANSACFSSSAGFSSSLQSRSPVSAAALRQPPEHCAPASRASQACL